jgi:hypothetical protein
VVEIDVVEKAMLLDCHGDAFFLSTGCGGIFAFTYPKRLKMQ